MQAQIRVGNAELEGQERRGWFLGHFITPAEDLRATAAVEVKWGTHPLGDHRQDWGINAEATTLSILIRGRFQLEFPDRQVILSQPGDYALWLPGVPHRWIAEQVSIVLTVRYPSVNE